MLLGVKPELLQYATGCAGYDSHDWGEWNATAICPMEIDDLYDTE
jgi:hypothetical protein